MTPLTEEQAQRLADRALAREVEEAREEADEHRRERSRPTGDAEQGRGVGPPPEYEHPFIPGYAAHYIDH